LRPRFRLHARRRDLGLDRRQRLVLGRRLFDDLLGRRQGRPRGRLHDPAHALRHVQLPRPAQIPRLFCNRRLMKPLDLPKAVGLALAIMIVNVAISFAVVAAYSYWVDPGHDERYYQAAAAEWIAPWSSIAFGWLLFLIGTYVLSRRSTRDALTFALTAFAA